MWMQQALRKTWTSAGRAVCVQSNIEGGGTNLGYLLNQFNASQQVHAKVNKSPFDSLLLVLFLFKHKHVMVEELLKFLVCEVDAQLLEAVELHTQTNSTGRGKKTQGEVDSLV
jgi:hypothetical protein